MGEDRRPEDREGALSARGFMRDMTDVNMRRVRARLAERLTADSPVFLRHPAGKDKGRGENA